MTQFLRFQPDADDEPRTYRLDRRFCDRWPVNGGAVAFEAGGAGFGRRHPLRLLDESPGGLGARSSDPLTPGTVVTVAISEPGAPVRQGVVLRCLPCGDGYRVGIEFARAMAA